MSSNTGSADFDRCLQTLCNVIARLRPLGNFLRAIAPCFEPSAPEQVHCRKCLAAIGQDRCGVDRTRSLWCQDTCVAFLPLQGRGGDLYVCMSKNSINALCVYIYLYIHIYLYICRMSVCVPRPVLPLDAYCGLLCLLPTPSDLRPPPCDYPAVSCALPSCILNIEVGAAWGNASFVPVGAALCAAQPATSFSFCPPESFVCARLGAVCERLYLLCP